MNKPLVERQILPKMIKTHFNQSHQLKERLINSKQTHRLVMCRTGLREIQQMIHFFMIQFVLLGLFPFAEQEFCVNSHYAFYNTNWRIYPGNKKRQYLIFNYVSRANMINILLHVLNRPYKH